jgi:thioredoxin 1
MVNKSFKKNVAQLAMAFFAIAGIVPSLTVPVHAQSKTGEKKEIKFTTQQWAQTLQLAKEKQQLIFVDAYASWCGPCKELKSQTFTDPKVAVYFNKNFVNVSLDMEKGEGVKFAEKYEVDSYPTLLLINGDGNIVAKSEGFLDAAQLNSWVKKAAGKS